MHALLAKPIDWFVIQLARRCVRINPHFAQQQNGLVDVPLQTGLGTEAVTVPVDFRLSQDGAFQFTSSIRTAAPRNNTVFGQLFRAGADWRKRPTAVLLHGWNAELCYHYMFPHLAARLAQVQINTAIFELPYHMRRRPRQGPVDDFISSSLEGMLEATRQAIADTRALCRWLESQGSPITGLWGFSLGAWLAGLLARSDPRLGFAVLTTPIARIDRAIAELPFCEPVRRGLQGKSLDLSSLNLAAQRPQLEPNKLLLVESRHDLFAPVATVEHLWEAWGHPEIWRLPHGHISVLMSTAVMGRTVEWIQRRVV